MIVLVESKHLDPTTTRSIIIRARFRPIVEEKCTGFQVLGVCSNMIDYEMGSSPVGVYGTSVVEDFKHG